VNARYGADPGIKVYSHHFASFHSRLISATASEAPYVLDGLLLHGSSLQPREHYTDTGGATLSAYKRQNRLDFALAEVGRIERTLFSLDWLESPTQRRRCQAGLNKGEVRHALAQAIFAHRQGRFADRTLQSQEHRASGLNLIIPSIAFWNKVYLGRAVEHLRARGESVATGLLAHVSPMGWSHIGLTGDYLWEEVDPQAAGKPRPLNDPASRLRAA
tara:strand:+ start:392 stop:1042 length:651 start_codon:yes stop_codon:yes gene_type:complete